MVRQVCLVRRLKTDNVSKINLQDYIKQLFSNLLISYRKNETRVNYNIKAENIDAAVEIA